MSEHTFHDDPLSYDLAKENNAEYLMVQNIEKGKFDAWMIATNRAGRVSGEFQSLWECWIAAGRAANETHLQGCNYLDGCTGNCKCPCHIPFQPVAPAQAELKAGQYIYVHGTIDRIREDGTILVRMTGKWEDQFVLVDRSALLRPHTAAGGKGTT